MTDQQDLHDALESLVPDPPPARTWGADARDRARHTRRRRVGAVVAAVVVAALAVPVVRSLGDSRHPESLDVTTHGSGAEACRQLHGQGLGFQVESRVVSAATAARWDSAVTTSGTGPVTVCVWSKQVATTVVAVREGRAPVVVRRGSYQQMADTMVRLGREQEREPASLTTAPFRCPHLGEDNVALPGTARLPLGATAALVCDSIVNGPTQTLTSGVDGLVRALNARPLTYSRASDCTGTPGGHGYTLVLDYPRGTRVVAGDLCGWVGVGPVQRRDTQPTIGDRFLAALQDQVTRSARTPPAPCQGVVVAPQGRGDISRVVAARFCPAGATGRGVLLSPQQLSRLTHGGDGRSGTDAYEQWSSSSFERPCRAPATGWPHLMLSDAWHQQFSVTLRCQGLRQWDLRFADSGRDAVRPVIFDGVSGLIRELVAQTGG